eukprot:129976-Rhodomonas_salina.1
MVGREEEERREEGRRKGRDRGHQACKSGGAKRLSRRPGPSISTAHLQRPLLRLLSNSDW